MGRHWELWSTAAHQVLTFSVFLVHHVFWFFVSKSLMKEKKWSLCVYKLMWLTTLFCMPYIGLCPDWETWDPVKPVENATEAMQLADDWLGIPQVRFPSSVQVSVILHSQECNETITYSWCHFMYI